MDDRVGVRRGDVEVTLARMGYDLAGSWERGAAGLVVVDVVPTASLEVLAAETIEPVTVSLNVARLLSGGSKPLPQPATLRRAALVAAAGRFAAELSMFAAMWADEARAALRRLSPALEVALNIQAQPWDVPAVSLPNTLPDDGRLAWHAWSTAMRELGTPVVPEILR